jgi:hypothetical protein
MATVETEVHENAVFPAMCCLKAGLNIEFLCTRSRKTVHSEVNKFVFSKLPLHIKVSLTNKCTIY